MTTGTQSSSVVVCVLPDNGIHGRLTSTTTSYKTWSGADYPSAPKTAPKTLGLKHSKGNPLRPHRKRVRELGEHAYSKSGYSVNSGIARCSRFISGQWQTVWYNSTCQNVSALKSKVFLDPSQEYKLLDKLRNRVYGSGFNPAVFAAEMPEALRMIRNASVRIGAGLHRLRSGDRRGLYECFGIDPRSVPSFRKAQKDLASLWLEIAYGWKPLLSDVESGAQYIGEALNGGHAGLVRASRSWEQHIPRISSGAPVLVHERLTVRFRLSYVIKALSVSPWYQPSVATVASVAWEKLPYSFVCDWFVPIGAYLEALRTSHDISGTVIRSLKREFLFGDPVSGDPSTLKLLFVEGGDFARTEYDFSRTISSEIRPPSPVDGAKLEALSYLRTANAVSLLVQRDWSALNKMFLAGAHLR